MMLDETQMRYYELLLNFGMVTGALSVPAIRDILVEALRAGSLSDGYIKHLRDQLTQLLADTAPPQA